MIRFHRVLAADRPPRPDHLGSLRKLVMIINSIGFAMYLVWWIRRDRPVFFDPDSSVELLPCLGFIFVFISLTKSTRTKE